MRTRAVRRGNRIGGRHHGQAKRRLQCAKAQGGRLVRKRRYRQARGGVATGGRSARRAGGRPGAARRQWSVKVMDALDEPSADRPRAKPVPFRPSDASLNWVIAIAFMSLGYAMYLRYLVIEQSQIGLACDAGLKTWLCLSR